MNSEATVLCSCDSRGVATLTLNRPHRRNAFDDAVIANLHSLLQQLAADSAVRVIVLTGAGNFFCAGMDLNHMRRQGTLSEAENAADALAFANCLATLDCMNKPVVARVNGGAYGGALGLIAAADIAIGVTDAQFAFTEVRLGIVPAVIAPFVVAAIGSRHARRWFLSAAPFDAQHAERMGLLHTAVSTDELDAAVEREVTLLLLGGPSALGEAKQLVRKVRQSNTNLAHFTAELLARLRASAEGQEGLAAFNAKRRPNWQQD